MNHLAATNFQRWNRLAVVSVAILLMAAVAQPFHVTEWSIRAAQGQATVPPSYPTTGYPATGSPGGYSGRVVPRAPSNPQFGSRPAGWPGASVSMQPPPGNYPVTPDPYQSALASQAPAPGPPPTPIEGARILARVDADVILYSEVSGPVNQAVEANVKRYGGQLTAEQVEMIREAILKQLVAALIPNKLLSAEARRNIPPENMPQVIEQFEENFDESELPKLIERAGVKDRLELDAKLRSMGTSLSREKKAYVEKTLGQQWLRQQIDFDREIPRQELLEYYEQHLADYEQPAQVRWQQLMKIPERYREAETKAEIAQLGNELQRGAPFDVIARAHSDAPSAADGGWYDWTTVSDDNLEDVHLSPELRAALVRLPINHLSRIIEDSQGFHIVRVVERKPATRAPFDEVRNDIRDTLRRESTNQQVRDYLEKLRQRATISTVFDEPTNPQPQVTGRPTSGGYR